MIRVTIDDRELRRGLSDLQKRQIPFATAMALTKTAQRVQAVEVAALATTFKSPTPFTMNAFGIAPARKNFPIASVFIKDVQSNYLAPYELGGTHFLGSKRGLLVPKDIPVNQYGNIPRGKLAALKGRSDIFIGSVTFHRTGQTISGVWQRPKAGLRRAGDRGSKGNTKNNIGGQFTGLKLLIRFSDALPVVQHLGFEARAEKVVEQTFGAEFDKAFTAATSSAK